MVSCPPTPPPIARFGALLAVLVVFVWPRVSAADCRGLLDKGYHDVSAKYGREATSDVIASSFCRVYEEESSERSGGRLKAIYKVFGGQGSYSAEKARKLYDSNCGDSQKKQRRERSFQALESRVSEAAMDTLKACIELEDAGLEVDVQRAGDNRVTIALKYKGPNPLKLTGVSISELQVKGSGGEHVPSASCTISGARRFGRPSNRKVRPRTSLRLRSANSYTIVCDRLLRDGVYHASEITVSTAASALTVVMPQTNVIKVPEVRLSEIYESIANFETRLRNRRLVCGMDQATGPAKRYSEVTVEVSHPTAFRTGGGCRGGPGDGVNHNTVMLESVPVGNFGADVYGWKCKLGEQASHEVSHPATAYVTWCRITEDPVGESP